MPRLTEIMSYGQGGLVTGLAAGLVLFTGRPPRLPRWTLGALTACAVLPVLAQLWLSTWYLFSPTYIDHIEASVASMTQYFLRGLPVYPRVDSYTFHGLLYGPLLPELNSLGYLASAGALGSKLIGWSAAWLAAILIGLTTPRSERNWAWAASLAAAACVLASFGSILTADRADSLLLLFAAVALWSAERLPPLAGLLIAALLAGLAANLKLHGPAYVMPALGWWAVRHAHLISRRFGFPAVLAAVGCMAIGLVIPFVPVNISAANYFGYVKLAANHGLNPELFAWNCVFLVSFWVPALLALRTARKEGAPWPPRRLVVFAAFLLIGEMAVNVVASKPGAGAHHLLPFVGFHSFLFQRLLVEVTGGTNATSPTQDSHAWREIPAARAAIVGIAVVLVGTAWSTARVLYALLNFDLQRPSQEAQLQELRSRADAYPHGMLGIAGRESYALTLFRPWITLNGTLQTDYGAWMDWNLSGVSDAPLAKALETCRIPYLFVPTGGEPFTMDNNYTTEPLFSDAVRLGFAHSYSLLRAGRYFDVYGCAVTPAGLVRRASP